MNLDFGGQASGSLGAAAGAAGDASLAIGGAADAAGSVAADLGGALGGALGAAGSIAGDLEGSLGGSISGAGSAAAGIGGSIGGALSVGGSLAADVAGAASGALGAAASLDAAASSGGFITGIFGATRIPRASQQLVKARFHDDDENGKVVLECLFNPAQYTIAKTNTWKLTPLRAKNVPNADFQGGGATTMQLDLTFDTYATPNKEKPDSRDVRDYTNKLLNLMEIDPKLKNDQAKNSGGRPHLCSFHWGETWSFKGVIRTVSLKFTLFDPDGTPVRATATVNMQQLREETYKRQNPTSGGAPLRASHVVQPGDTLELIAYQEYADPTQWRVLAQANGLEDPRALRPGQRLLVP